MQNFEDIIDIYYLGIENEYELDMFSMRKDNVDMEGCVIVRYLKVRNLIKDIKKVRHVVKLTIKLWWIVHFILTYINFLKTIMKCLLNKGKMIAKGEEILILSNNRVYSIFKRFKSNYSGLGLIVPWGKKEFGNSKIKSISSSDILEYSDIFWALKKSMEIRKSHKKRFKGFNQSIILQTYDSFNWFLMYRVLQKIEPSCVWFVNHYDRWAILFDRIPIKSKKKQIQHGIVDKEIIVPNKLVNIEEFYCFDENSKKIFKENYHENIKLVINYKIINNYINFMDTGFANTIIFIGSPYDSEKEEKIINNISKKFNNFTIFIKPHPSYSEKMYLKLEKGNIKIVREKNFFPKVNLVVSYKSTLAYDYENIGIPVIYHEGKTVKSVIEEVSRYIIRKY